MVPFCDASPSGSSVCFPEGDAALSQGISQLRELEQELAAPDDEQTLRRRKLQQAREMREQLEGQLRAREAARQHAALMAEMVRAEEHLTSVRAQLEEGLAKLKPLLLSHRQAQLDLSRKASCCGQQPTYATLGRRFEFLVEDLVREVDREARHGHPAAALG